MSSAANPTNENVGPAVDAPPINDTLPIHDTFPIHDTLPENAANNTPTAAQFQQTFFDNMPDYDWLRYDREQGSYLKQNIAYALFSTPTIEGDLPEGDEISDDLQGYSSREKERVIKIYNQIREQGKYSRQDEIFMACLQVVYVTPKESKFIKTQSYWHNLENRRDVIIRCTPVFKIRKCAPSSVRNGKEKPCCKVYIDEDARVYQDWDSYLQNNTLPRSIMVVPTNGEYTGFREEEDVLVSLTVLPSASLGAGARLLSAADTGATAVAVVGLGAAATAAALPLVAVAGAAVAVAGTTAAAASGLAGVYGVVRSACHLADRKAHDQSIDPITEPEARGSWLNVVMSSVGLSASAAAAMLSRSASAGNNLTQMGKFLTGATTVLGHATVVTSLGGVLNGLYTMVDKYKNHSEYPTKLELFQFSTSLLFFAGTAMSNRTAQSIIEESQTNTINNYRTTLRSNRHRKIFDKVSAETRRVGGFVDGNTDVIRAIRTIDNKDQFWQHMIKVNKDVKMHGVRVSLNPGGSINLNAQHSFKPSTLAGMESGQRANLLLSMSPADKSVPNVPTKLQFDNNSNKHSFTIVFDGDSLLSNIKPNEYIRLGRLVFTMSQTSFENIERILSDISAVAHKTFFALCTGLVERLSQSEFKIVAELFGNQFILEKTVEFVYGYLNDMAQQYTHAGDSNPFVQALKEFFVDGRINETTFKMLKDLFVSWARGELRSMTEENADKIPVRRKNFLFG